MPATLLTLVIDQRDVLCSVRPSKRSGLVRVEPVRDVGASLACLDRLRGDIYFHPLLAHRAGVLRGNLQPVSGRTIRNAWDLQGYVLLPESTVRSRTLPIE